RDVRLGREDEDRQEDERHRPFREQHPSSEEQVLGARRLLDVTRREPSCPSSLRLPLDAHQEPPASVRRMRSTSSDRSSTTSATALRVSRHRAYLSRSNSRLRARQPGRRSEEHTSELQSRGHLVCRLLLEKKKSRQVNIRYQLLSCAFLQRPSVR